MGVLESLQGDAEADPRGHHREIFFTASKCWDTTSLCGVLVSGFFTLCKTGGTIPMVDSAIADQLPGLVGPLPWIVEEVVGSIPTGSTINLLILLDFR